MGTAQPSADEGGKNERQRLNGVRFEGILVFLFGRIFAARLQCFKASRLQAAFRGCRCYYRGV